MRVIALFSGGKDSTYALYRAIQEGYDVERLVTIFSNREDSWMYHVTTIELSTLIAESIGIPLYSLKTSLPKEKELTPLENAIRELKPEGIVSGAVASNYQKKRIDKVAEKAGVLSVAPLWHMDERELLCEMIDSGFKVMIVGCFAMGFDSTWLGRLIDYDTIEELEKLKRRYGISMVGEGGEYETAVLDAPIMKKEIIINYKKIWNGNCGEIKVDRAYLI